MKYVGQSRTNVDNNNMASIKSTIQAAASEYLGAGGTIASGFATEKTIAQNATMGTVENDAAVTTAEGDSKTLVQLINDGVGTFPAIKSNASASWKVTIASNGNVTVSYGAASNNG